MRKITCPFPLEYILSGIFYALAYHVAGLGRLEFASPPHAYGVEGVALSWSLIVEACFDFAIFSASSAIETGISMYCPPGPVGPTSFPER